MLALGDSMASTTVSSQEQSQMTAQRQCCPCCSRTPYRAQYSAMGTEYHQRTGGKLSCTQSRRRDRQSTGSYQSA